MCAYPQQKLRVPQCSSCHATSADHRCSAVSKCSPRNIRFKTVGRGPANRRCRCVFVGGCCECEAQRNVPQGDCPAAGNSVPKDTKLAISHVAGRAGLCATPASSAQKPRQVRLPVSSSPVIGAVHDIAGNQGAQYQLAHTHTSSQGTCVGFLSKAAFYNCVCVSILPIQQAASQKFAATQEFPSLGTACVYHSSCCCLTGSCGGLPGRCGVFPLLLHRQPRPFNPTVCLFNEAPARDQAARPARKPDGMFSRTWVGSWQSGCDYSALCSNVYFL